MGFFSEYTRDLTRAIQALDLDAVERVRAACAQVRDRGGTVFVCGNGGSASTASHFANDLGKGASLERERRFKVLALTDCIPWMTALANDLDYDSVFAEQLANFAAPGDLLIAISGSGNSRNVLRAAAVAHERGMQVAGLTGFGGGELAQVADLPVVVDSSHMGRVEDVHLVVIHLLCYYFMELEA